MGTYPFVFVSGYAGWDKYSGINKPYPYWGLCNGDLMEYLNSQGFESYAACVDPVDSAWDRACELYAQLAGTVVDYGKVHSSIYKHNRFGKDYAGKPLFAGWGQKGAEGNIKKVNLIGHSFGGATIRLLTELLAYGSVKEINGTAPGAVSGLFTGGKADWVNSITTLASPHNGTTLANLSQPLSFLLSKGGRRTVGAAFEKPAAVPGYLKNLGNLFKHGAGEDTGAYDLSLDGAARLNKELSTFGHIYYFSFPTDSTAAAKHSNRRVPDPKLTNPFSRPACTYMGSSKGITPGGMVFDEAWFHNDGVVNTISTYAPMNAPRQPFDENDIKPGVWNVMPLLKGDHHAITGGLTHAVDVKAFYVKQMKLINSIERSLIKNGA